VNAKQIIFLGFALFTASLTFFSSNRAKSVVPGWHVTILPGGYWNFDLLSVYFLGLAVIYGYIPKGFINSVIFIIHAILSIAPLLVQRFILFSSFTVSNPLNAERVIKGYKFFELSNCIFVVSQAIFLLMLIIKQFKKGRTGMRTT
jgi:hypothetical protein